MPTIADRLRDSREKRGLTTYQAAELAGVSQSSWSDWETGKSVPRGSNRMRAAIALGVSSEWLRIGELPGPELAALLAGHDHELMGSAIAASENYLALFHQDVPLTKRMELAQAVATRCQELGLASADQLTLAALHEVVGPIVFR